MFAYVCERGPFPMAEKNSNEEFVSEVPQMAKQPKTFFGNSKKPKHYSLIFVNGLSKLCLAYDSMLRDGNRGRQVWVVLLHTHPRQYLYIFMWVAGIRGYP